MPPIDQLGNVSSIDNEESEAWLEEIDDEEMEVLPTTATTTLLEVERVPNSTKPSPSFASAKKSRNDAIESLMIQHLTAPKEKPDENAFFLKDVGQQLMTLPLIARLETKVEIQQLLFRKQKEYLTGNVS